MPVPAEYQQRLEPAELQCMTPQTDANFQPRKVHRVAAEWAAQQIAKVREALAPLPPAERRQRLRDQWAKLLGDVEPQGAPSVKRSSTNKLGSLQVEKILLTVEPQIEVPLLLLSLADQQQPDDRSRHPVVLCIAQQGKDDFLVKRAHELADLLLRGAAVCLPDLRGTGETSPGPDRNYYSQITEISAQNMKLGQTLVGARLRDLRSVIQYLRARKDLDSSRIGLWGDSFAPVNPQTFVDPPLRTDHPPHLAEPIGALLALLAPLYEPNVKAVVARGGLASHAAILDAAAFYVPHDAVVPGATETGDLCDLAGALCPMPLRIERPVDGRNRSVGQDALVESYGPAQQTYASAPGRLVLKADAESDAGEWLAGQLAR
jgi:hypothetical protein